MKESRAIGIRLDKGLLEQVDFVSKAEHLDRSSAVRVLLEEGYSNYLKRKAAEEYKNGKTTVSAAAQYAHITVWEMEQYLVRHGYKSEYSVEDLRHEVEMLSKRKQ